MSMNICSSNTQRKNSFTIKDFKITNTRMGYISLALNICFLLYFGVFAVVPLIYLVHSFRPTLPWSCEGFKLWAPEQPKYSIPTICNTKEPNNTSQLPSVLFFRSLFISSNTIYEGSGEQPFAWSYELLVAMFVVWTLMALFFYKNNIKRMSLYIRYSLWILILLLLICLVRFIFLPGSSEALRQFFIPTSNQLLDGLLFTPIWTSAAFGAGWGILISLSSYNKFNTNIMRHSWIICVGQILIFFLYSLAAKLIDSYLRTVAGSSYYYHIEEHWVMYLSSGWVMSNLPWSHMWCILFFSFLTLSALLMMTIQLFSVLTAIFDNFEYLRKRRQEATFGLIGLLGLNSIYFCSNHGLKVFNALSYDVLVSQAALNLLLLLVVLWIYGRERFQRDVQFMLNQRFATWRVYLLRYVAAAAMLFVLIISALTALQEHLFRTTYTQAVLAGTIAILLIFLPWLVLPGYAQWSVSLFTGSFGLRFKRACQPKDWYPTEADNRQRYEEAIDNMNIMQPLSTVGGKVPSF